MNYGVLLSIGVFRVCCYDLLSDYVTYQRLRATQYCDVHSVLECLNVSPFSPFHNSCLQFV